MLFNKVTYKRGINRPSKKYRNVTKNDVMLFFDFHFSTNSKFLYVIPCQAYYFKCKFVNK